MEMASVTPSFKVSSVCSVASPCSALKLAEDGVEVVSGSTRFKLYSSTDLPSFPDSLPSPVHGMSKTRLRFRVVDG